MHDFRRFPIYNMTFASDPKAVGSIGIMLFLSCTGFGRITRKGMPPQVALLLAVLAVVCTVAFFVRARLMYTGTGPEYLTVRGFFRTRKTAWSDIQSIELVRARGRDQAWVVVVDQAGRKFKLPHLYASNVPDIEEELAKLRGLWIEFRGEGWAGDRPSG
jgi:hypothetical protein